MAEPILINGIECDPLRLVKAVVPDEPIKPTGGFLINYENPGDLSKGIANILFDRMSIGCKLKWLDLCVRERIKFEDSYRHQLFTLMTSLEIRTVEA